MKTYNKKLRPIIFVKMLVIAVFLISGCIDSIQANLKASEEKPPAEIAFASSYTETSGQVEILEESLYFTKNFLGAQCELQGEVQNNGITWVTDIVITANIYDYRGYLLEKLEINTELEVLPPGWKSPFTIYKFPTSDPPEYKPHQNYTLEVSMKTTSPKPTYKGVKILDINLTGWSPAPGYYYKYLEIEIHNAGNKTVDYGKILATFYDNHSRVISYNANTGAFYDLLPNQVKTINIDAPEAFFDYSVQLAYIRSGTTYFYPYEDEDDDVYWLAKVIASEAGSVWDVDHWVACSDEERSGVGWTVLNRLNSGLHGDTIKAVVTEPGQYAYNQEPTAEITELAEKVLDGEIPDPTDGAMNFFSPISMPQKGGDISEYDVAGGLHIVPGTSHEVYYPSWAKPVDEIDEQTRYYQTTEQLEWSEIDNIRNWYFMFYRSLTSQDTTIDDGDQITDTDFIPSKIKVLMNDGSIEEMDLEEYVKGVVVAEMYSDWPIEALKAQAVVARTFAIKNTHHDHSTVDVCTDHTHCQAWASPPYTDLVEQAVTSTHNMVITYNGEIIKEALFFGHCNGHTRNSEDYAGWNYVPYLRGVACDCGYTEYNGHGVGMCQYGAKAMAEQGSSYEEILKHYYTGIALTSFDSTKTTGNTGGNGTPGFEMIFVFLAVTLILFWKRGRNK